MVAERSWNSWKVDEVMSLSLAVVLSLERPMRELSVGGATRAIAASGAIR